LYNGITHFSIKSFDCTRKTQEIRLRHRPFVIAILIDDLIKEPEQFMRKLQTTTGCGTLTSGHVWDYLVCRYNPPGNYLGQNSNNIFRQILPLRPQSLLTSMSIAKGYVLGIFYDMNQLAGFTILLFTALLHIVSSVTNVNVTAQGNGSSSEKPAAAAETGRLISSSPIEVKKLPTMEEIFLTPKFTNTSTPAEYSVMS
jgi:hypothetical protein